MGKLNRSFQWRFGANGIHHTICVLTPCLLLLTISLLIITNETPVKSPVDFVIQVNNNNLSDLIDENQSTNSNLSDHTNLIDYCIILSVFSILLYSTHLLWIAATNSQFCFYVAANCSDLLKCSCTYEHLHLMAKQIHQLELSTKQPIYTIFIFVFGSIKLLLSSTLLWQVAQWIDWNYLSMFLGSWRTDVSWTASKPECSVLSCVFVWSVFMTGLCAVHLVTSLLHITYYRTTFIEYLAKLGSDQGDYERSYYAQTLSHDVSTLIRTISHECGPINASKLLAELISLDPANRSLDNFDVITPRSELIGQTQHSANQHRASDPLMHE